MKVSLLAFGIARDILGQRTLSYEVDAGTRISGLKAALISDYSEMEKLSSLAFAVNEEYVDDDYEIREGQEVVIIPPVSGG